MSKNISLSDLRNALQPLTDAINTLKTEQLTSTTQVSELYAMVTNLSTKIDVYDQNKNNDVSEPMPPKKKSRKLPPKKSSKSSKSSKSADQDTTDLPKKKKKVIRTAKKGTLVDEPTSDSGDSSDEEQPSKRKSVKKTVKRAPKKKTTKKKRDLNKMEYFNKMYDQDNDFFHSYIDDEAKEFLEEKYEEKWEGLNETQLHKAKRSAYYNYMKKNHDGQLQAMKSAYIEELKKPPADLVEKENSSDSDSS